MAGEWEEGVGSVGGEAEGVVATATGREEMVRKEVVGGGSRWHQGGARGRGGRKRGQRQRWGGASSRWLGAREPT